MQPVRRPAVCAKVSPWPSCASKVLISRAEPSPCESRVTLPSVIVPSTSIRSTLICAARFLSAGEVLGIGDNGGPTKVRESLTEEWGRRPQDLHPAPVVDCGLWPQKRKRRKRT